MSAGGGCDHKIIVGVRGVNHGWREMQSITMYSDLGLRNNRERVRRTTFSTSAVFDYTKIHFDNKNRSYKISMAFK